MAANDSFIVKVVGFSEGSEWEGGQGRLECSAVDNKKGIVVVTWNGQEIEFVRKSVEKKELGIIGMRKS